MTAITPNPFQDFQILNQQLDSLDQATKKRGVLRYDAKQKQFSVKQSRLPWKKEAALALPSSSKDLNGLNEAVNDLKTRITNLKNSELKTTHKTEYDTALFELQKKIQFVRSDLLDSIIFDPSNEVSRNLISDLYYQLDSISTLSYVSEIDQAAELSLLNADAVKIWFDQFLETDTVNRFKQDGIKLFRPNNIRDEHLLGLGRAFLDSAAGPTNRFPDIFSPTHTIISYQINDKTHYLHANRVKMPGSDREMILTQAPIAGEESLFWRTAIENGNTIVDLTGTNDNLISPDGEPYNTYPKEGETLKFEGYSVSLKESRPFPGSVPGTTYIYTVKDSEGQEHTVTRHYFPYWADHQAIGAETLEQLVDQLATDRSIVHCRAGVGRSGTFAMASFIKDAVANGEITKANVQDKLNEMIIHGRTQRGLAFVQQDVQLNLLIQYTLKLLEDKAKQRS